VDNALDCGHEKAVKIWLAKEAEMAATDVFGRTALHIAVVNGQIRDVEMLLAVGANVATKDTENGRTALHHAASMKSSIFY
jgi:ankyrin repeat protein